jgi:hypothetical protein
VWSEATILSLAVGIAGLISGAVAWVITLSTTRAILMQHLTDCKAYRENTARELASMQTNQLAIMSSLGQLQGSITTTLDRRYREAGGLK